MADKKGGLFLYAVPPGEHQAGLLRTFQSPDSRVASQVSLSSNAAPTVCAVWRDADAEAQQSSPQLWCYAAGVSDGRLISRKASFGVGVRADGRAVAWTENESNTELVVADLDGDVAKERSRQRYAPAQPADAGLPASIDRLDWLAPRTLAGTDVGDSDEGKGLCVIDLDKPRPHDAFGFGSCVHPNRAESEKGYARFEGAVPVATGEVVTVERAMGCCFEDTATSPGARAVRIRVSDGQVLSVMATPRAGRDVTDVSGSGRALLYTTAADGGRDLVVSLRWAGELRGSPLTGLPADLILATAQP